MQDDGVQDKVEDEEVTQDEDLHDEVEDDEVPEDSPNVSPCLTCSYEKMNKHELFVECKKRGLNTRSRNFKTSSHQ